MTPGVLPLPSFFHQPSVHSIYFLLFSALNFRAFALTTLLSARAFPSILTLGVEHEVSPLAR